MTPIEDKCRSCNEGFFLGEDGKCHFSINGCVRYHRKGCAECRSGFTLREGKCIIYGCNYNHLDEYGCRKCNAPFRLTDNRTCGIEYCQAINFSGCEKCVEGYHL